MHIIIDWTLKSITRKVIIYKNAFSISTKGYLNEIPLPHFLHFPFKKIQLITGIKSHFFIFEPHLTQ